MSGDNNISFESSDPVQLGDMADDDKEIMTEGVIKSVETEQMKKKIRAEMGIHDIPSQAESIPPELPKMIFNIGSKIIGCDRFKLDAEEAKNLAKHLSIIIGPVSSKVYSVFMVIIIIISKINDCWNKAKDILKGKKSKATKDGFDEATESTVPVHGDGT